MIVRHLPAMKALAIIVGIVMTVFRSDTGFEESQVKAIQPENAQDICEDGVLSEEETDDESNVVKGENVVKVSSQAVLSECLYLDIVGIGRSEIFSSSNIPHLSQM
jgi:hypothetical protein